MALRPAVDDDWSALFGTPPPAVWFGLTEASRWMIDGMGVVYQSADDRWWVAFQRAPGVRKTKTAHKAGRQLLADCAARGITVHTICDMRISGAEKWLVRFGFKRSGENIEGYDVWTL